MKIETLEDLLCEELRELYDEEERLVEALPKMVKNSGSARLREAFQQHLEQTKGHVARLEECFRDLGREPDTETADGMKGLVKEGERVIDNIDQSPLRDAALIGAAKRVEHYEIGAYSGAIAFARLLGHQKAAALLEETLGEEREANALLTRIAEETVNQEALQLGAHQRS
jgi:ferritin-like metal-binding protein YciE